MDVACAAGGSPWASGSAAASSGGALVASLAFVSLVGPRPTARDDGVDDRRGSLSRPATERQPLRTRVAASAERQRCEISAVPLTRRRVLVVVLNLAAGIVRFQDCVAT